MYKLFWRNNLYYTFNDFWDVCLYAEYDRMSDNKIHEKIFKFLCVWQVIINSSRVVLSWKK